MDIRHEEPLEKTAESNGIWPEESLARVPYWVYQDEANYKRETQRLFEAATWNFVCLEADIPNKGDYRTNHVGAMPVIVVRGADGGINCFENLIAQRFHQFGRLPQVLQSCVIWPLVDRYHGYEVADTHRDAAKQKQREFFVFGHAVGTVRQANLSLISANVYRNRLLPTAGQLDPTPAHSALSGLPTPDLNDL